MTDDLWATLVDRFADDAYASVKGQVRTRVMHQHLLEHLPAAPAAVLDVGGGAGHQSFPLAYLGYDVTLLDSSPAMLAKARERLQLLPEQARARVTFIEADAHRASEAIGGRQFGGVLCHGVLGYLDEPASVVRELCRCVDDDGIVSIMTGNAETTAVRPALERRWRDALTEFDQRSGVGVLGVRGRADTVDEVNAWLQRDGVDPQAWYGVWLFVDWLEFSGVELDADDTDEVDAIVAVELEASRRDPYRRLSRVFHVIGRKSSSPSRVGPGAAAPRLF